MSEKGSSVFIPFGLLFIQFLAIDCRSHRAEYQRYTENLWLAFKRFICSQHQEHHSSRDIYWLRSRTTAKKNSNSLPILKTIDSSIVWQARDSITHLPCPFHNEWMNSRWLECLIFRKKNKYGIESESCSSQPRPQPNGSVCGKCIFRLYKEWREANEHQLIGFEGIRRMAQNRFNDGLNLIFSFMIWRHVNTSCHNTHQQHTRTHMWLVCVRLALM